MEKEISKKEGSGGNNTSSSSYLGRGFALKEVNYGLLPLPPESARSTKLLLSLSVFLSTVNSQLLQEDVEVVTPEDIYTGPLRAETHCLPASTSDVAFGFRKPKAGSHPLDSTWGQFSPLEQKERKKK